MQVERVTDFATHRGPWCRFKIDFERLSGRQHEERRRLASLKGLDWKQCGYPAEVLLDGQPHCRHHAGEALLRVHIGPAAGRFGRD